MLQANSIKYVLKFKQPGGTSRGILYEKNSWFLILRDTDNPDEFGLGECGIIPKLSIDDRPDFEEKLEQVAKDIENYSYWLEEGLYDFPAIRFGLETALIDLKSEQKRILFPSAFTSGTEGISINGLIWMGSYEYMCKQIIEKIETGFRCIKLKIGSIDFKDEVNLLKMIRKDFSPDELELRVDANGAFSTAEALEKLKVLSSYGLHSIEQPIKANQWEEMAELCQKSPLPIALDEELIGETHKGNIRTMLQTIQPQYIIIKPGLLGGFKMSELFINEARRLGIGWWATSALESNIGLNAIAQWTYTLNNELPQGLGTGKLYTNNVSSPLEIRQASLFYNPGDKWNLNLIIND
jgi:o-succinylbenzoate synthase